MVGNEQRKIYQSMQEDDTPQIKALTKVKIELQGKISSEQNATIKELRENMIEVIDGMVGILGVGKKIKGVAVTQDMGEGVITDIPYSPIKIIVMFAFLQIANSEEKSIKENFAKLKKNGRILSAIYVCIVDLPQLPGPLLADLMESRCLSMSLSTVAESRGIVPINGDTTPLRVEMLTTLQEKFLILKEKYKGVNVPHIKETAWKLIENLSVTSDKRDVVKTYQLFDDNYSARQLSYCTELELALQTYNSKDNHLIPKEKLELIKFIAKTYKNIQEKQEEIKESVTAEKDGLYKDYLGSVVEAGAAALDKGVESPELFKALLIDVYTQYAEKLAGSEGRIAHYAYGMLKKGGIDMSAIAAIASIKVDELFQKEGNDIVAKNIFTELKNLAAKDKKFKDYSAFNPEYIMSVIKDVFMAIIYVIEGFLMNKEKYDAHEAAISWTKKVAEKHSASVTNKEK